MTLNANNARDEYTASGAQTIFNYTFKIYDSTDIDVYVTPAGQVCSPSDLTIAYSVSGVGNENGGTITLNTPTSNGDLVTIVSSIPSDRTTDYQNNGDFRPSIVNDDFDRTVSLVKQVIDLVNRALTFEPCEQGVDSLSLPPPKANSFLQWKPDLSGMQNFTFGTGGIIADVSVSNYTSLRALTSSELTDGQVIFVTNNGVAGRFVVRSGSVTDNNGTLIVFDDDSSRYAERQFDGPVFGEWFECSFDNSTDDTSNVNAWFKYISDNNLTGEGPDDKTAVITDNLFIYGGASLQGKFTLKLTADPTQFYWIIGGAASYGGASDPLTGLWKDFTIDVNSPSQIQIGLYYGSANGLTIDGVTVKSNGKCQNKAFSQLPNANFITGSVSKNISLLNCTVENGASGDGEVVGFEQSDNFYVNNFRCINGFAYDDFGIHKCNRGVVENCMIESFDGRIYVSDSDDIKIVNNTIDYNSGLTDGQGMGIYVGSESIAVPNVAQNIVIEGNHVYYRSGITGFGYGVRVEAGRNVRVIGNRLVNESVSQSAGNLYVENQSLPGWVDPTGIDPNDNPQSHDVIVADNDCDGLVVVTGGDNGIVHSNNADSFDVESPAQINYFKNNVATSGTATDNQFDASNRDATELFFTRFVLNTGASYIKGTEYNGGGSSLHRTQRDVAVTHFIVSSTSPITAGFYQIELLFNGVKTGATKSFQSASGDKTQLNFIASAATKDYIANAGDTIEVQAKTNNGTPTPNDVTIEVYGFYLS